MVFLFSVGMYETPLASFWFMYKDKPPKVRFPDLFLHLTKCLKLLTASSESFVFSLFPNVPMLYPLRFQNPNRKGCAMKRTIQKENHD